MTSVGSASRLRWRHHPVRYDVAVALTLVVGDLLVGPWLTGERAPTALEAVLIVLTLAVVPLRTRLPVLALALTTVGAGAVILSRGLETLAALAPVLALYTVVLRGGRRTTVLAWASTAAVLALVAALGAPGEQAWQEALRVVPWTAAVAAVADGLRSRRAYLAAVEERAVRAERSREDEARRRVAEERVRIARELHDVVAHHMAVVSVQAGVAQHLLATAPEASAEALAKVRRSAAAVLDELGDVLSVLREPGAPAEDSAPAPGLARLDALVESFAGAGLQVQWSLHGAPRDLPPTLDLVAYRILEEGLTNALKHGTGTAHLNVDYRPTSLRLRVRNDTAGPRPAQPTMTGTGSGHGLLGMRERATAVGGRLRAEPDRDGRFHVEAVLPLRESILA